MSGSIKSKRPQCDPSDSMLRSYGCVLYGDHKWQQGLAGFFDVHVNTIYDWVYSNVTGPNNRYSRLNTEVIKRIRAGTLL